MLPDPDDEEAYAIMSRNREELALMSQYMSQIADNSKFLEDEVLLQIEKLRVTQVKDFSSTILHTLGVNRAKRKFLALIKRKSKFEQGKPLAVPKPTNLPNLTTSIGNIVGKKATGDDMRWWKVKQREAATHRKQPWRRSEPTDNIPVPAKTNYDALLKEQAQQRRNLDASDVMYRQLMDKYHDIQQFLTKRLSLICSSMPERTATPAAVGVLPALINTPRGKSTLNAVPCSTSKAALPVLHPAPCRQPVERTLNLPVCKKKNFFLDYLNS
eukprot:TRINITY_DN433_c2_g1_i2.p1 TRINITY_DN433_c2_g1~~TRINITY_DN433_c2_g1_i2.p1  ORF type:complete len:285 (+),score=53.95 TRINITY_DN433_c2_g1_i2:44-856(+)